MAADQAPDLLEGADSVLDVDSPSTSEPQNTLARPVLTVTTDHEDPGFGGTAGVIIETPAPLSDSDNSPSSSRPSSESERESSRTRGRTPSASAIRRTRSAEAGGRDAANGLRIEKHLRFTAVEQNGAVEVTSDSEEIYYPGRSDSGRHGEASGRSNRGISASRRHRPAYFPMTEPGTPNISETANQIKRTLSLASVDTLILLSSDREERSRLFDEITHVGRGLVWRKKDEKRMYPDDLERAAVHAAKRGLRSFLLGYGVRGGFNVILLLFQSIRLRRLRLKDIRAALFSKDPVRFAAVIGTFTFLNNLTLDLLRLAPPFSYIRRRVRAGLFKPATFGPPEREGPEGERRWQAAVAGAVGGLALLWETRGRATGIAQQLFVRGLQAVYNQYTPHFGIHIPHGDVLLFGLCCGQIMYAWLLAPETIPRSYANWIQGVSGVPKYAVGGNRTAIRQEYIPAKFIEQAMNAEGATKKHTETLTKLLANAKTPGWKAGSYIPCAMLHPWVDSCIVCNFERYFIVARNMLPVYSALHIIPMLLLRRKAFLKAPLHMLFRSAVGIARSCSFLAIFVVIYQALFCLRSQTLEQYGRQLPTWFRTLLRRKENMWLIGFSTCLSLFVEEKRRRAELAMYCLPRALESAWSSARKRSWVPIVPFGETILGAAAMAMIMDAYKHKPDALSGIVRRVLYQVVGPL